MKLPTICFACILTIVCCGETGAEESATWKAGLAKAKITPGDRMQLSGYASRTAPFEQIEHDIFVKVLALEDEGGHQGVLVTADLIGFPGKVSDEICKRLETAQGLKREQILLNASHTHAGPEVSVSRGVDAHHQQLVQRYVAQLQDKVVEAVDRALDDLQPAQLSWGRGVANFVMNRREYTATGVKLGVQPSGLADRTVPVLRVADVEGNIRCVVFGAACHNTTLTGGNLAVSGDYAGFAQYHVEQQLPDVQSMFVLGCAGDANPYPRGTMELAQQHGEELGAEVCRVLETELQPITGPLRTVYARAELPLAKVASRSDAEKLAQSSASYQQYVGSRMLEVLERGEALATHYSAPLAVWQFGDDLTLVGISGETVVDYVPRVEQALGPLNLWVAGYCNDVFGYLPSARILQEGGYETRGLIRGGVGIFAPEAEQTVVETIAELARDAGRNF